MIQKPIKIKKALKDINLNKKTRLTTSLVFHTLCLTATYIVNY